MSNLGNNPLFKHFRQPALYLKLPSRGKFYPDTTIDIPPTSEIPVYPMTVRDELTMKTPDALMNGEGMISVVSSCCPNLKDPWQMPSVDVDAVFIAIRLASYGAGMDIKSTCPNCKSTNEHTVDLRVVLDGLETADYSAPAFVDGLTVRFKPQTYRDINNVNLMNFEEQRLIESVIANNTLSEEQKAEQFKASFEKLKKMNIDSVLVCIESIGDEDNTVKDPAQIYEFLDNCSREVYQEIKKRIDTLVDNNKVKPIKLTCDECSTEYENQLAFDQSNFFG